MGKLGLFIFTRDLRLEDNTTLNLAKKECDTVIPIFILNPEQIDKKKNKYYSEHSVQFMRESLNELDMRLRKLESQLYYFHGHYKDVINKLIKTLNIDCVYINLDVTIYSKKRHSSIKKICDAYKVKFTSCSDLFLLSTPLKKVYSMFTPYYNSVINNDDVRKCKLISKNNYYKKKIIHSVKVDDILDFKDNSITLQGGRSAAIKRLSKINPSYDSNGQGTTSMLSSYLKFGCISSRECYWYIKKKYGKKLDTTFLRQIIWRDFYYQLFDNKPELFTTDLPKWTWRNNTVEFNVWCYGQTGVPIIDSAMRELKETGNMPNRLRLVVSCYLVKILNIDWRWGEQWFARYLTDYDPILNNANWQWISGTLPGSKQPWFRILHPTIQSKKFDKDCVYIKKWIPELRNIEPKIIHDWMTNHNNDIYLVPIVDFEKRRKQYVQ